MSQIRPLHQRRALLWWIRRANGMAHVFHRWSKQLYALANKWTEGAVREWRETRSADKAVEWYCEAWAQRRGVSEPCESGSTHDAPDFDCHWRVIRIEDGET